MYTKMADGRKNEVDVYLPSIDSLVFLASNSQTSVSFWGGRNQLFPGDLEEVVRRVGLEEDELLPVTVVVEGEEFPGLLNPKGGIQYYTAAAVGMRGAMIRMRAGNLLWVLEYPDEIRRRLHKLGLVKCCK